jgi:hypothetical protein
MDMRKLDFRPQTDGFAFKNNWRWDDAEKQTLHDIVAAGAEAAAIALGPVILAVGGPAIVLGAGAVAPLAGLLGPFAPVAIGYLAVKLGETIVDDITGAIVGGPETTYGLCGGMAFAALDYYKLHWVVPRGETANDQPLRTESKEAAALRDYLWARLERSLQSNAVTFLTWMAVLKLPGAGGPSWLLDRSKEEFNKLKSHIDNGEPWPIGLVGTTGNPMDNHQILAYGYEDNGTGSGAIWVYDNLWPDEEIRVDLDFSGSQLVASSPHEPDTKRGPLQGFFCEDYSFARPPVAVGLVAGLGMDPSTCAGIDESVELTFTVENVGYHRSPAIGLHVDRSDGGPFSGESILTAISQGDSRGLAAGTSLRFQSPGMKLLVADCAVEAFGRSPAGCVRTFPELSAGAHTIVSLTVNQKLKITPQTFDCSVPGIAGQATEFHVATPAYTNWNDLEFQWSVVGATAGPGNLRTFTVQMPAAVGVDVTVSLLLKNGKGCDSVGSFTLTTIDPQLGNLLHFTCLLRELEGSIIDLRPVWPGDPAPRVLATEHTLREVEKVSGHLAQAASQLLKSGALMEAPIR